MGCVLHMNVCSTQIIKVCRVNKRRKHLWLYKSAMGGWSKKERKKDALREKEKMWERWREREREGKNERDRDRHRKRDIKREKESERYRYIYIYIYIQRKRKRERIFKVNCSKSCTLKILSGNRLIGIRGIFSLWFVCVCSSGKKRRKYETKEGTA